MFVWLATRIQPEKDGEKHHTFRGICPSFRQEDVKVHQPEFEGLPLRGEGLELRGFLGGSSQDKDSKWLMAMVTW